ncbi:Hypothetical protein NTJ_13583 [Nesidiocoris tenuis]|uniref:Uncharacterized protein n=1 Tax=Nesidiocoris tenuis TaxID=355587 RepID=A0ABN7B8Q7_9HEMI|nr:Hypothetical protein NTJ_13583 [Nesidiocoris tenuis]
MDGPRFPPNTIFAPSSSSLPGSEYNQREKSFHGAANIRKNLSLFAPTSDVASRISKASGFTRSHSFQAAAPFFFERLAAIISSHDVLYK